MTENDDYYEQFIDDLIGLANANTLMMSTMTDEEAGLHLVAVIDGHDIVWAIWPDDDHPSGIGLMPVSDRFGLHKNKPDTRVSINAIACPDHEQAEQLVALVERSKSQTRSDN
jgi:hypothetical protein